MLLNSHPTTRIAMTEILSENLLAAGPSQIRQGGLAAVFRSSRIGSKSVTA